MFKGVLSKLRTGLARTRASLGATLRAVAGLGRVDEAALGKIEQELLKADVGVRTTARLIAEIRDDLRAGRISGGPEVIEAIKNKLRSSLGEIDRALRLKDVKPAVIMVVGVNGAGKTTSIAKLCALLQGQGKKVLLGACDTFRAGAVHQLEVWAQRLGVEVVRGQQGGDPAAVAYDACEAAVSRGVDVLILDTAGRLQTQDPLMRQLAKVRSVVTKKIEGAPHEVLLVVDATAGQNALRQAEVFLESAGVTGIVLSKLDGTAKGGVVFAIQEQAKIPVKLIGVGETPADMQPFDPAAFVEALFGDDAAA